MPQKKRTTTQRKNKKLPRLTFTEAVTSLSFLGSLWRTSMAAAVVLALIALNLAQHFKGGAVYGEAFTGTPDALYFSDAYLSLLASIAAFFVYDIVFVGVVSRYRMHERVDKWLLFIAEGSFVSLLLLSAAIQAEGYSFADSNAVMRLLNFLSDALVVILLLAVLLPVVRAVIGVSYVMARVRVSQRR